MDPEVWLALDEEERIRSVRDYHLRKRIALPNTKVHAIFPTIVENQVALGDSYPVKDVLSRLMREGLDRHEAIHTIGSVIAEEMHHGLRHKSSVDIGASYAKKVQQLTVESWKKSS